MQIFIKFLLYLRAGLDNFIFQRSIKNVKRGENKTHKHIKTIYVIYRVFIIKKIIIKQKMYLITL